jgi:hypothetical protein
MDYVTLEELKERHPQITGIGDDDLLASCITAASEAVDAFCGRRFSLDTSATARWFRPGWQGWLDVDDIATTSGLVIQTDEDDDGTFETTWTTDDYDLEPLNGKRAGIEGLPYDRVVAVGDYRFRVTGLRPAVQVTAVWGWSSVPEAVRQATFLKAAQLYRRKDSPDGVLGGNDFGTTRVSRYEDPEFVRLLNSYRCFGANGLTL